jgi:hypothetical protein
VAALARKARIVKAAKKLGKVNMLPARRISREPSRSRRRATKPSRHRLGIKVDAMSGQKVIELALQRGVGVP